MDISKPPKDIVPLEEEREGLLTEYRTLKTELHNAQGQRLQLVSLTAGAFGVILSISAGVVFNAQNTTSGTQLLIAIGSAIALYAILIPSLIIIISIQQGIQRQADYIRLFIEPQIPGLNWESRWEDVKLQHKYRGGLRGWGSIYYFFSFLALLLPLYALSQDIQNWLLILVLIPFIGWSFYLSYDLHAAISKGWKWANWEDYEESQSSPDKVA